MGKAWARGALVGVGVMAVLGVGCKRQPAAVQPVVRTVPRAVPAEPAFPDTSPAQDEDLSASQSSGRSMRRHRVEMPQAQQAPRNDGQQVAAQKRQDARLLQQQEAASQRQQQELDGIVQQSVKVQQQQQAEPRIQDAPEPAPGVFAQPAPQGIQDAPGPAETLPAQPGSPDAETPRIQDAPGPAQPIQPQPTPQPTQPQE